ncbi:Rcs stress response system protein RcsF [Erwinia amylovora]|uniref:Outer membrane lipoprotein RcsF n=4 Tax=Erwinia amylovora TaxID=552 RepID=A0A830ZXN7_ERWAM|nr:Rcs stress response system protein RcsF [Erwinia amylovora]CBX81613.1 Exopolysaccharide synthesis regulator [Erwinia amylovora ATCC BAA-2158]CCP04047.1 Exopolysaccharide synthesis regulator [Erwinia amylovora Ea644]CCP08110.1 Exopolysaccharide synthesis regulator [Erwinia amylovora MR1]CDK16120.1 Exopolysaccharide synthesis regulator [Erwinia amylovora LA635]CDK19486.1 Exopolysaccharide synthesis regulator [Erwinia amylovora LA636]CDK22858.1 Exopolysaccharide synthesis regulator [Erwinia a
MRVLPLCLLAMTLTGCSLLTQPYKPVTPFPPSAQTESTQTKAAARPAPVKLYTNPADLVSMPFRDLGEVYGDDCQSSNQDSPPNLATARKRMQLRASGLKANAVLLHRCEIVSAAQGCFRQAICQGSALKVSKP